MTSAVPTLGLQVKKQQSLSLSKGCDLLPGKHVPQQLEFLLPFGSLLQCPDSLVQDGQIVTLGLHTELRSSA